MAKGFFILYGPPGGGKSTEAGITFQDSLYIGSSPNILHNYKQMLQTEEGKASGLKLPKTEVILDKSSTIFNGMLGGQLVTNKIVPNVDEKGAYLTQAQLIWRYAEMALGKAMTAQKLHQPPPYNYVIWDEMGTFVTRAFKEIAPTVKTKDGKPNKLGAYGDMGEWVSTLTDYLRQLLTYDVGLVLVSHHVAPEPDTLKMGGPKFLTANIMGQVCADADGVIMRILEDRPPDIDNPGKKQMARRVWRAHASQHWHSKLRGLPDSMFEEIEEMPLREIITRSGFET